MQMVKQFGSEWKLIEFNLDTNNHCVVGLFDTFENACHFSSNPEYEIIYSFLYKNYKCVITQLENKYIGGIYVHNKLIYIDPNKSTDIMGPRIMWRTKKEIILQIHQFIDTIHPSTYCMF
jgi:hypothetical protein